VEKIMTAYSVCPNCQSSKIVGNLAIGSEIKGKQGGNLGATIGFWGGLGLGAAVLATVATGGLFATIAIPAAMAFGAKQLGENLGSGIGQSANVGTIGFYCEDCKSKWI
jgi:hypothetical protein